MTYHLHGVTVASEVALPGVRRAATQGRASIVVSVGSAALVDERVEFFHHWRIKGTRGRPWLSIGRRVDGYLLRFPDLVDFDVSAAGDRIVCRPSARLAGSTLQHLLLDQVLPLALSRTGHLVLHASAVHVPRLGCVTLVGTTGSGKSTLAAALGLRGCPVLTDDCLVVQSSSGQSTAVPGYPGLRLWRDAARGLGLERDATSSVAHYTAKRRLGASAVRFRSAPSRLAAIFVLGRRRPGAPTRSRVLDSRDGLMALAPYTHVMDVEDRRQLLHMFRSLSTLVTHVPVVRLNMREGRGRVLEAADEVLAAVKTRGYPMRAC
jgi:energy-coupling factor transporter ATP-binding protein EcfA2